MADTEPLAVDPVVPIEPPPPARRMSLAPGGAPATARRATQVTAVVAAEMGRQVGTSPRGVAAARAASRAFMRLGGVFMKVGQGVAAAPGVWGEAVAAEFRDCLDTGPAVPFREVVQAIEDELGRPLSEVFSSVDPEPIGRASLAVVHRGVTTDGQEVAVKILRPGIEASVATDFALARPPAALLADRVGSAIAGAVDELLNGLHEQLEEELELRNEAASMDYHRRLFERLGIDGVVVPRFLPSLSGRRVLTMEYLHGRPLDSLDDDHGVSARTKLGEDLVGTWLMGALSTGIFHGDLHAGNLLVLDDGRLGVLDWGIVGRLDEHTRKVLRIGIAAALGDESRWAQLGDELELIYGDMLTESMGTDRDELIALIRSFFEPFFTEPFSAFTLVKLVETMPGGVGGLGGTGSNDRRGLERVRHTLEVWRANRQIRSQMAAEGVRDSPFNRGTMMLVKQLVYLDRHGHALLGDRPLLSDPAFYGRLVDAAEHGTSTWR
jgi:aarF domain-containing kinase